KHLSEGVSSHALEEFGCPWPVAVGRFCTDARNPGVDWFDPDREVEFDARELLSELSSTLDTEKTTI
ncbi:MAG: hypothetical protein WBO21_09055, partial [Acidimicrobiia bacterium]